MAAALISALMGHLGSAAHSISTLFSYDLWGRFLPQTSLDARRGGVGWFSTGPEKHD